MTELFYHQLCVDIFRMGQMYLITSTMLSHAFAAVT